MVTCILTVRAPLGLYRVKPEILCASFSWLWSVVGGKALKGDDGEKKDL